MKKGEEEEEEEKIKCKTCRQYISPYKMFLHEGFCQKNNIFCEHCDKVFLTKDYDNHILEISKNLSNKSKDSIIKRLKTDFNGFESDYKNITANKTIEPVITNNIKKNNRNISVIEEYKIRNPIFIEPNGEIKYGKNNDYLLPLFNFESIENNIHNYPKYNVIFKTEYNYDLSNNLINYKNINYYNDRKTKKINHLNHKNILYNNNIFNEKNSILILNKHKENKNKDSIIKRLKTDFNGFESDYKNI